MKDPKQVILTYTPYLFSIAIFHSIYKNNLVMYSLMTGLLISSLVHHGKYYDQYYGKKTVHKIDVLLAHSTVLYTLFLNFFNPLTSIWTWITYISIGFIGITYYFKLKPYDHIRPYLHATMHIAGVLGSNTVLI